MLRLRLWLVLDIDLAEADAWATVGQVVDQALAEAQAVLIRQIVDQALAGAQAVLIRNVGLPKNEAEAQAEA
eukprot:9496910-Pyramimonas_sp.AAC.2